MGWSDFVFSCYQSGVIYANFVTSVSLFATFKKQWYRKFVKFSFFTQARVKNRLFFNVLNWRPKSAPVDW